MADEQPIDVFPYRFELVPLENLFVDRKYQRKAPRQQTIDKMASEWAPHLVGTLAVSERDGGRRRDGTLFVKRGAIVDGQRRWLTGKKMKVEVVPCCVYEGMTVPEEAAMFSDIQTKRKGVTSDVRFNAAVVAGDPEALAIKALVESCGYVVGQNSSASNAIGAVSALEVCYRRDDEVLERAMIAFQEAKWFEDRRPTAWHIRGLFRYLRDNPNVDDEKLIRRIFIAGPDSIYIRAQNAQRGGGLGSQSEPYMAQAFKAVYTTSEAKLSRAA